MVRIPNQSPLRTWIAVLVLLLGSALTLACQEKAHPAALAPSNASPKDNSKPNALEPKRAEFGVGKIVFESTRSLDGTDALGNKFAANLWIINADGTTLRPLTNLTADSSDCINAKWSPDGSKIVFESARALDATNAIGENYSKNIWVMNNDGSEVRPLTRLNGVGEHNTQPQWSPNGNYIIFRSERSGLFNSNRNIWIMKADGSGLSSLTNFNDSTALVGAPQWSPDGTRIAFFTSKRDTEGVVLWTINVDGKDLKRLLQAKNFYAEKSLQWSPDSTKILALSPAGLLSINSDGSGEKILISFAYPDEGMQFQWSPNGTKIAYDSNRNFEGKEIPEGEFTRNIWIMDSDGNHPKPLTKLTAYFANSKRPQWSRDSSKIYYESMRALNGTNEANADPNRRWSGAI